MFPEKTDIIEYAVQNLQYEIENNPNGLWKTNPQKYLEEVISNPRTYHALYILDQTQESIDEINKTPPDKWLSKDHRDFFETLKRADAKDLIEELSNQEISRKSELLSIIAKDVWEIHFFEERSQNQIEPVFKQTYRSLSDEFEWSRDNTIPTLFKLSDGYRDEDFRQFNINDTFSFVISGQKNPMNREDGDEYDYATPQVYRFKNPKTNNTIIAEGNYYNGEYTFSFSEHYNSNLELLKHQKKEFDEDAEKIVKNLEPVYLQHKGEIEHQYQLDEIKNQNLLQKSNQWNKILLEEFNDFDPNNINDSTPRDKRDGYKYPSDLLEFMKRSFDSIHRINNEFNNEKLTDEEIIEIIDPNSKNFKFKEYYDLISPGSQERFNKIVDFIKENPDLVEEMDFEDLFRKIFVKTTEILKKEGIKFQDIKDIQIPTYEYRNGDLVPSHSRCPDCLESPMLEEKLKSSPIFSHLGNDIRNQTIEELNPLIAELENLNLYSSNEKNNSEGIEFKRNQKPEIEIA